MEKIILFLFLSIFAGAAQATNDSSSTCADNLLVTAQELNSGDIHYGRYYGSQLDMSRIKEQLSRISNVTPIDCEGCLPGRRSEEQKERFRRYIVRQLEALGLAPQVKAYTREVEVTDDNHPSGLTWAQSLKHWAKGVYRKVKAATEPEMKTISIHNVVVDIKGAVHPNEVIELSAHYDTTSVRKPGADDNGSGITTLLEVARIFARTQPARTIRLVFADLEEEGFYGTLSHIEDVWGETNTEETLMAGLVIDTIGYAPISAKHPVNPPLVVEVGTLMHHNGNEEAFNKAAQLGVTIENQFKIYRDRYALSVNVVVEGSLPDTADHGPYWAANLPAVLIAAPYEGDAINPGYHKTTDTMMQINWGYFEYSATLVVEVVAVIAEPAPAVVNIRPETLQYWNDVLVVP